MKVQRGGVARTARDAAKRHKRPCRSAPSVPGNVTVTFHRREIRKREIWRAHVKFDAVTTDVASRPLDVELYQVELRATDASGDPVETNLQAKAAQADGQDFTVETGTAPVNGVGRELDATGDVIKKTLTGLTAGIDAQVVFYARKDLVGSDPTMRFYIYNVTDSVEVTTVTKAADHVRPRVTARRGFTPVGSKTYEARVTFTSGTGIGILDHIQWHDKGDTATWRERVAGDDDPRMAVFTHLARPRSWYYQARVRVLNRIHGGRCWSAWSSWTTATIPATGDTTGPPAPTGVTLTFDKVEGSRRRPWRARTLCNEIPWWFPADDDPVEGADAYRFQLQVSNDGGSTVANTRTVTRPAKDEDTDTTARYTWFNIRRTRSYRTRVKARDENGRWGAWSAWTSWAQPSATFTTTVQNLTWSNPTPATLVAKWDEPTDPSDVDRYKVVVRRKNADLSLTVVDTGYTTGTRWRYHIPLTDRDRPHRVRVTPVLEELHTDRDDAGGSYQSETLATDTDSSDLDNTASFDSRKAVEWTVPGTVIAKHYDQLWTADRKYRPVKVLARVGRHESASHPADDGTPGGAACIVNLRIHDPDEGTNVALMDKTDRLKIPADEHRDTVWAEDFNVQSIAEDEIVSLRVAQAGGSRAAKNLVVRLILEEDQETDVVNVGGLSGHGRGYSKMVGTAV